MLGGFVNKVQCALITRYLLLRSISWLGSLKNEFS